MSALHHARSVQPSRLLSDMGIPIWKERDPILFFPNLKIYPDCLVILSEAILDKKSLAFSVFSGMLKVLECEEERISLACLKPGFGSSANRDLMLSKSIARCQPRTVLLLGELGNFGNFCLKSESETKEQQESSPRQVENAWIYTSYHPKKLVENPKLKKETYQVLLGLKERLKEF